jgi:hypothetical protein
LQKRFVSDVGTSQLADESSTNRERWNLTSFRPEHGGPSPETESHEGFSVELVAADPGFG